MNTTTTLLSLGLALTGSLSSEACWTFIHDAHGLDAQQQVDARIITPIRNTPGAQNNWFDYVGFRDATGNGLSRDVTVGLANIYGEVTAVIPAGPATPQSEGCRWAYLGGRFQLDPMGENYLFYEGMAGDLVQLLQPFQADLHIGFEFDGLGYLQDFWMPPAFQIPPNSGYYAFGANAYATPEPAQWALSAITLAAGLTFWWRHSREPQSATS